MSRSPSPEIEVASPPSPAPIARPESPTQPRAASESPTAAQAFEELPLAGMNPEDMDAEDREMWEAQQQAMQQEAMQRTLMETSLDADSPYIGSDSLGGTLLLPDGPTADLLAGDNPPAVGPSPGASGDPEYINEASAVAQVRPLSLLPPPSPFPRAPSLPALVSSVLEAWACGEGSWWLTLGLSPLPILSWRPYCPLVGPGGGRGRSARLHQ